MWTLTVCCLILMLAVVALAGGLVWWSTRLTGDAVREIAELMGQTVATIIRPVVDPEPIRQTDVPGQTEMFSEPAWVHDWDESQTQRSTSLET